MDRIEIVDELIGICVRQAGIIRDQEHVIAQLGALTREEDVLKEGVRLKHIMEEMQ